MINAVDLDQYRFIDESSMIIDDFTKSSKCICLGGFGSTCKILIKDVVKNSCEIGDSKDMCF